MIDHTSCSIMYGTSKYIISATHFIKMGQLNTGINKPLSRLTMAAIISRRFIKWLILVPMSPLPLLPAVRLR
jgi:hypothetical protein